MNYHLNYQRLIHILHSLMRRDHWQIFPEWVAEQLRNEHNARLCRVFLIFFKIYGSA